MKKIYMQPQLTVTNIQPTSSLMITSTLYLMDSGTKITNNNQILVKKNYTDYNVWDDDWSN